MTCYLLKENPRESLGTPFLWVFQEEYVYKKYEYIPGTWMGHLYFWRSTPPKQGRNSNQNKGHFVHRSSDTGSLLFTESCGTHVTLQRRYSVGKFLRRLLIEQRWYFFFKLFLFKRRFVSNFPKKTHQKRWNHIFSQPKHASKNLCLLKVIFYGFYHGIHHHFSPPFGDMVSSISWRLPFGICLPFGIPITWLLTNLPYPPNGKRYFIANFTTYIFHLLRKMPRRKIFHNKKPAPGMSWTPTSRQQIGISPYRQGSSAFSARQVGGVPGGRLSWTCTWLGL